jgi:hypothetical protein
MALRFKRSYFIQLGVSETVFQQLAFTDPKKWRMYYKRLLDSFVEVDEYELIKQEAIELTEWSLAA